MNSVVFDSSALIAHICGEKGADYVENYLENSVISSVNYSEFITFMLERGATSEKAEEIFSELAVEIIVFDEYQAIITSELRSKTKSKGLSLGDRACLALAKSRKIPVVTADKIWSKLDIGVDVKLIR